MAERWRGWGGENPPGWGEARSEDESEEDDGGSILERAAEEALAMDAVPEEEVETSID